MEKTTFEAEIKKHPNLNASYVEFPFDTVQLYGKKGQVKVKALFDGRVDYRGSLSKMGNTFHWLGITQEKRKELGKTFGDPVLVEIWEDKEERIVEIPDDVAALLKENPEAEALLNKMSYTRRKEYIRWITEAKKPETREARKHKIIEMILAGKKGI